MEEANRIKDILKTYENASGQVVNFEKSEVSFSRNMGEEIRDTVRNCLGISIVSNHSKYLGLPIMFGRSKKEVFAMVVERVWKKIKGWKEKFLSSAGKEVLIKAVAQAIHTYVMSCYKIPESVFHEIESLIARFWWAQSKEKERCTEYYGARDVVQRGACWRIGNGEKVNILKDRWIPNNTGFKILAVVNNVAENACVSDLIDKNLGSWKKEAIQNIFPAEEAKKIVSISLSMTPNEENMMWHFEKSGDFSVKTAYHATRTHKDSLQPGPPLQQIINSRT
ncbi:uncharacterized protein LOC131657636 [Vicia villosa]|uniref:uncharacterized protein LOC131657636 n=1 Tax=Vicia villosa TaxID=3911 RepID=UPI00273A766A|nr:uncharacterized protein LOC131657636 [Vicia villosa]